MKKISATLLAISLALGCVGSAQADRGRYDRPAYGGHDHRQNHHGHRSHHGHRGSWVGPAALLAITGLAIGATAYAASAPPVYQAPVYAPPPRPVEVVPQAGNWYFCGSSGEYYPHIRYCPEGWQVVMPPR